MGNDSEKGIIEFDTDHGKVKLSPATVRKYLVSGGGQASDQDVMMFLTLCRYQRLNPFLREAYLIKYSKNVDDPATIVVGKDVHVKRAGEHPQFDGLQAGIVVEREGTIIEREGSMKWPGDTIVGGWAISYRKDRKIPHKVTVSMEEYIGKTKGGDINRQWQKMPGTMIAKVAIAQVLRFDFTKELEGLYVAEEMQVEPGTLDGKSIDRRAIPEARDDAQEYRAEIAAMLEDNGALMPDEWRGARSIDMDEAKTIEDLVTLRDEIKSDISAQKMREARVRTKDAWSKVGKPVELDDHADEIFVDDPLPGDEPEEEQKTLEIF